MLNFTTNSYSRTSVGTTLDLAGSQQVLAVGGEKGQVLGVIGRRGDGPGEFMAPHDLTLDMTENPTLYVTDQVAHRIQVFDLRAGPQDASYLRYTDGL